MWRHNKYFITWNENSVLPFSSLTSALALVSTIFIHPPFSFPLCLIFIDWPWKSSFLTSVLPLAGHLSNYKPLLICTLSKGQWVAALTDYKVQSMVKGYSTCSQVNFKSPDSMLKSFEYCHYVQRNQNAEDWTLIHPPHGYSLPTLHPATANPLFTLLRL